MYFFDVTRFVDASGNSVAAFTYDNPTQERANIYNSIYGSGNNSCDLGRNICDTIAQLDQGWIYPSEWKPGSNIAVYVKQDLWQDHPVIHSASFSSWVDPRGHIHTIDALKRQIGFKKWLSEKSNCNPNCNLVIGRQIPFHIEAAKITGILDRSTLDIPLMKLEWRYNQAYHSFLIECAKTAKSACSGPPWPDGVMNYWADTLRIARNALDHFQDVLMQVPFSTPSPMDASSQELPDNDTLVLPLPKSLVPQELDDSSGRELTQKELVIRNASANEIKKGYIMIGIPFSDDEPETQVTKSISPDSMSPDMVNAIKQAQDDADQAVKEAESLIPPQNNNRP